MWEEADQTVHKVASRVIKKWHPNLDIECLGFLFRDTSTTSQGLEVHGKASKVSEKDKVFLDFDFIVWFAKDHWVTLTPDQKAALMDHELSHCVYDEPGDPTSAKIKGHDFEGFSSVLERHGLWHHTLETMGKIAQQLELPGFETKAAA